MNCTEIKSLLDLYLDSELDARSNLAVQRHLVRCPECAKTFQVAAAAQQRLTCALRKGRRTSSLWTELEQELIGIDARSDARDLPEVERGWRFWLWPDPHWYAALAMVWLIMLAGGVAVSDRGSDGRRVTVGVAAPTERAMEEQRRLLTELLGDRALSATDEAKPRSPFRGDLTPGAKAVEGYRAPRREAFAGAPLFRQVVPAAPKLTTSTEHWAREKSPSPRPSPHAIHRQPELSMGRGGTLVAVQSRRETRASRRAASSDAVC